MQRITLNEISPDELKLLIKDCVNQVLENRILNGQKSSELEEDEILTVTGAADFLSLKTPTIYSKCQRGELPFMKRSGRLYFSKKELLNYLKGGKQLSHEELHDVASKFFKAR